MTENNIGASLGFLKSGSVPHSNEPPPVSYDECPPLFLVLELADAFLDLRDHCCCCGTPMPLGLKPSVCPAEICNFQLCRMGIGSSLCQEIARDPLVADLLVSLFASSVGTSFLNPAPPGNMISEMDVTGIFKRLPRMEQLAAAHTDAELAGMIGAPAFELLRWIILSNRSHLAALPEPLALPYKCRQFLALLSEPEAEEVFQHLRTAHGSSLLWHGSGLERWHSIVRRGLKNATGTSLQAHGSAYGAGIYFATDPVISLQYAQPGHNKYAKSVFPESLSVLALCEVADVPEKGVTTSITRNDGTIVTCKGGLHKHQGQGPIICTCTMEEAVVVRFLLVGLSMDDIGPPGAYPYFGRLSRTRKTAPPPTQKLPNKIPTITELLEYQASQ
jgi:poly [ADP-ribose] polymerase 6/8